jgi:ABC-2 type transport system ATP-binding protein
MMGTIEAPSAPVSEAAITRARQPIVRVSRLTKTFATRRSWRELTGHPWRRPARVAVVDDVSFEVMPGEFFGLLGANAAGKTTLFRMLSAQLIPDSGSASIDGHDPIRDPRAVHAILTPVGTDERSLNWRLTARANLELFAALYGVDRREADDRIDDTLRTVALHTTGEKMVGTFSSGMKQRLLIARALLARPRVLLLDEPTRSLDPISARQLREFLREEIVGRRGCTVLLATHSAEEAFELCDRVAVLERGRLIAVGRARDLMGEVSDDRYELEVREEHLSTAARLLETIAFDAEVVANRASFGWAGLRVSIPGGPDGAAEVLGRLMVAGVDVSRLQRLDLTLADLIERIVARPIASADA